jgi:hypothetical protein
MGILELNQRARTRLFVRRDRYGRFFTCLVFVPRDRFNTAVRERIEALLDTALHGERSDSTVLMGEAALAQLTIVVRPKIGDQPGLTIWPSWSRASPASCATGTTKCAMHWCDRVAIIRAWCWPTATRARCRLGTSRT